MENTQMPAETLLEQLKENVKKSLTQNNGRLTPDQIESLCTYRRMTASTTVETKKPIKDIY